MSFNSESKYDFVITCVDDFYNLENFQLKTAEYTSHMDILIIDNAIEDSAVASITLNDTSYSNTLDSVIITHDKELIKRLRGIYLDIWKHGSPITTRGSNSDKINIIKELIKQKAIFATKCSIVDISARSV